jgi:predicted alpha/beta superfamily hydrolase
MFGFHITGLLAFHYPGRLLDCGFCIQPDEIHEYKKGGMRSWLLFFYLILLNTGFSQEVRTSFVLYAPGLHDSSAVFIAGSAPQLGNWNPSRVKMEFAGTQLWKKEIVFPQAMTVQYKYTLGSWEREGTDSTGAPLQNFSFTLSNGKIASDTIRHWKTGGAPMARGRVTGMVKYHKALNGEGIKERDIIVWLPPGYDPISNKRYPVMYLQDGQNIFDPATSAFGTDWQVDETADSMIRKGAVDAMIIVGIYNTQERNVEYIPSDKGRLYREFIVKKLKPFIDSAYRTKPGRSHNFIGGSSAGGILAFMMVWEYPDFFSKAICMSPAFRLPGNPASGWNYVSTVKADAKRKKVFFYIDNGGPGLEQQLQPGVDEMLKALYDKGYKKGRDFIYVSDPTALHNEQAWAKRFPQALRLVAGRQ